MLQSTLYQILEQSPKVVRTVLPLHQEILTRTDSSWTEADVKKAFHCILEQRILPLNITLFLDALDEYSRNHENLANFLRTIAVAQHASLTRLKIFFSSRPLQIFLDKFGDVPGFDIRDHTVEDVKTLVHSKLSQNSRMSRCIQVGTPQDKALAAEFGDRVSSKAEGIFLWVILVLDELLDDFTDGATIKGLMDKLDYLPPKLEDFYAHTLWRLPQKYFDECMLIFEVMQCAMRPLNLHDLYEICRCAKIPSLLECTPCTAVGNEYDNDRLQR